MASSRIPWSASGYGAMERIYQTGKRTHVSYTHSNQVRLEEQPSKRRGNLARTMGSNPRSLGYLDIASYSNATIWLYYWIYGKEFAMSSTPQKRALNNYRERLKQRGMARFEVLGLDGDRDLIRSLANRLAGDGPDSARIRATIRRTIAGEPPKKGGILSALRRSPQG